MKTFVKSNGSLHSGNNVNIKIFPSLPTISDVDEGEVFFVENSTFYQRVGNNINSLGAAAPAPSGVVGDIVAYYGSTNPDPEHLVICNGGTFSSTDFPELYSLLGTNTTPDLTGYHLKGVGNNSAWTSHDAISLKSKVAANYPNHTHTVSNPGHTHSINSGSHYHCYVGICTFTRSYGNTFSICTSTSCPPICHFCGMATDTTSYCTCYIGISAANLGTVTIGCPSTASGYNAVRYGSETKCKDKTILFLMRAK